MLKKIIHKIAHRHHPWRGIEFDELAEVYMSMTLRKFGLSMVGIFVPVFLYQNGVSLQDIYLYFTLFFFFRVLISKPAARIVGRIGPKHGIAISTVINIVFISLLLSYTQIRWPLFLLAFVFTSANGLFFIAFQTDFSKVKHSKHGGKELGWLHIFSSLGGTFGPLIGGVVATAFSPSWTFMLAVLVLLGSLIPLFLTNEPVKIHQKISFSDFKPLDHSRDFLSMGIMQIAHAAALWMWPLLLAVFIFTDDVYAKVGGVVAIATFVSAFAAFMFGKFVDNQKGLYLLRYGSLMHSLSLILRSAITTGGGALALGVTSEPAMLSVEMPLYKGLFDSADTQPGHRIVYIMWSELISAVFKGGFCLGLFVASHHFDPVSVLRAGFVVAGLLTPLVLTQRFPALKRV